MSDFSLGTSETLSQAQALYPTSLGLPKAVCLLPSPGRQCFPSLDTGGCHSPPALSQMRGQGREAFGGPDNPLLQKGEASLGPLRRWPHQTQLSSCQTSAFHFWKAISSNRELATLSVRSFPGIGAQEFPLETL